MPSANRIICLVSSVFLLTISAVSAITITVAKSGADCQTINEALNKAQPGDVIKIVDIATYEEEVTIDSTKCPLTLTSKDPTSLNKPMIKFQDKIHVHPKTAAEALIDSMINYDQNGALRIIKAHNVIIDGIAIDGGGVYPFGYPSVWSGRYGLQHGNAAIDLWTSGDVIIRNCDISNAYFGIYNHDMNMGGIYADLPSIVDSLNTIPILGTPRTGNHLIERNRIHNNSWGISFESVWDLGSTIRYNLIYENHHPTDAIAKTVQGLTADEGNNQPGGAFLFKDNELSPLAIYNNTFYRNFAIFAGHWQAGYQHLVFNNIFGPPYKYWANATPQFNISPMELTTSLTNRIFSCIYSAQVQAPQETYVRILDEMPQVQGVGGVGPDPGTLIVGTGKMNPGFPASAVNRWLEMESSLFLSTNPASTNFLEPKWSDPNVAAFIIQQGWEASGVKNTDGTRADLGAIEQAHGSPGFVGTIQLGPLPMGLNGANAQITFTLDNREGAVMTDPLIKLFRLVKLTYKKGTFGSNEKTMIIADTSMQNLVVPTTPPVKVGPNLYTIAANITGEVAFIEMFVEATGADGKRFTTTAGFLPYRSSIPAQDKIEAEIYDKSGTTKLSEVRVADTVLLRITPFYNDQVVTDNINLVLITLLSGFELLDATTGKEIVYPSGVMGPTDRPVIFTKIPDGSIENISVAAKYKMPPSGTVVPFLGGTSIKMLSGAPEQVLFFNPPSNSRALIPPIIAKGTSYPCSLMVYDKYGNSISEPVSVVVKSITPTVANVISGKPDTTILTDSKGIGSFFVKTTNTAREGDMVTLAAHVAGKTWEDTADMVVGKPSTSAKGGLANRFGLARQASYEVTVKCFDLQGRRVFQSAFFTNTAATTLPGNLQRKIPGMASKVFLMDITVKDRASLKQTRNVLKMVAR